MTQIPVEQSRDVPVDETGTFARRRDDQVELTLELPSLAEVPEGVVLLLRRGKKAVSGVVTTSAADGPGVLVHVALPSAELRPGTWRCFLDAVSPEGPTALQARLVVHPRLPLALLTGPRPRALHEAPAPRPPVRSAPRPAPRRAAHRALDAALSPLPSAQAQRVRRRLRRAYRRVNAWRPS